MTWQPPRESDYTKPTELCPHPEWWSTENALSTEIEVSEWIAATVKMMQPYFVVEVGTHYGQTAEKIARVLNNIGHAEFVSLEVDIGMYESAMHRCVGLPVHIIWINSLDYIPPKPINFLFVDGSADRIADVRHFLPYMAPRGVIVVHDTCYSPYIDHIPELIEECGGDVIQFDTPRGVLIVKLP